MMCKTSYDPQSVQNVPGYQKTKPLHFPIALNGIYFLTSQIFPSGKSLTLIFLLCCSHTKGEPRSKQRSRFVTALVQGK